MQKIKITNDVFFLFLIFHLHKLKKRKKKSNLKLIYVALCFHSKNNKRE